jgi:arylsulfatase A-like enzyme
MAGTSECDRVILITIDSLRRGCLDEMPTLDALATDGAEFRRTFAHSNWTPLSFPSILGPEPVFASSMGHELVSPTLAEHLSDQGIDTV